MRSSEHPSWWNGAQITAKAAWLHYTHRAKTIEEAFSMLARRKKKPAIETRRISVERYQDNLAKRGLD